MAGAGRGPLPSLPAALQWNAPAEECCIAVVVVLVDVCNALLACMQRSLINFSRPFSLYCHVEQFTFRDVMVSISECSLVEVVDWRNVVLLELSYVVEGEA